MIPFHKLAAIPPSQRLRKAAKLFGEAEQRLIQSGELRSGEEEYLGKLAEFLSRDENFSGPAAAALVRAGRVLDESANSGNAPELLRRTLNSVYYLLLSKTGTNQADWDFIEPSGKLDASKRQTFSGMLVYLEDIRSPFNVGSMFRTAESFGAEKIWLSPFCADPHHKRARRSSMGCVDILPWERFPQDPFERPEECRNESLFTSEFPFTGIPVFALETGGVPLGEFLFPEKGVLIAGSEELGVSPQALSVSDTSLGRVTIPSRGAKGSLNVSVAFGIVMQAWAAQLTKLQFVGE